MKPVYPLLLLLLTAAAAAVDAPRGPPPARVVVATVEEAETHPTQELVGAVAFDRVSDVSAEVAGIIAAVHVLEGQRVAAGSVLAELNTDLKRQDIAIQQRERESLQAEIERGQATLARLSELLKSRSASREAYDEARFGLAALVKRRERVEQTIARLELELDKGRIRAPFDGLVLERFAERGEWLAPGAPLARVASTADAIVELPLPESLVAHQRLGTRVAVRLGGSDDEIDGRLLGFRPIAERRSRTLPLKIAIADRPDLYLNQSARVLLPAAPPRLLRMLPRDAVVRANGRELAYTVVDGKAQPLVLNIVARLGERVGVDGDAVRAGMAVIVDGNDRLRPDTPVVVVEPEPR